MTEIHTETTRKLKQTHYRANVISETDKMRVGLFGAIADAATEQLVIVLRQAPAAGEYVQIDCENQLQRFQKRVEATVLGVSERSDGLVEATFVPRLRLSPLEVRALKPRRNHWL